MVTPLIFTSSMSSSRGWLTLRRGETHTLSNTARQHTKHCFMNILHTSMQTFSRACQGEALTVQDGRRCHSTGKSGHADQTCCTPCMLPWTEAQVKKIL